MSNARTLQRTRRGVRFPYERKCRTGPGAVTAAGIGDYCSPGGLTSPSDGDAAIGASGSCQAVPTSRQLPETAAMLTGVVRPNREHADRCEAAARAAPLHPSAVLLGTNVSISHSQPAGAAHARPANLGRITASACPRRKFPRTRSKSSVAKPASARPQPSKWPESIAPVINIQAGAYTWTSHNRPSDPTLRSSSIREVSHTTIFMVAVSVIELL